MDQLIMEDCEGNYDSLNDDKINPVINQVKTSHYQPFPKQCFSINVFENMDKFEAVISNIISKINNE